MHTPRLSIFKRLFDPKRDGAAFLIVFTLTLLSRLPFLTPDFGLDDDAWRIALAARNIAESGQYHSSRLPGYPLVEMSQSLLWPLGPLATNTATAILSALGASFFALTLRKMGARLAIPAALALAFTPVIYANSTNTMDYVWSLAFLLAALYAACLPRPFAGGLLLGMAIGARLTAAAMLLPLGMILWNSTAGDVRALIKFSLSAAITALLWFTPVFLIHGLDFLTFYDIGNYPPITRLLLLTSVGVWGHIGALSLALVVFIFIALQLFRKHTPESAIVPRRPKLEIAAWFTAIALVAVAFLRLPLAAGYWIPAIPFAFLLLAQFTNRRVILGFCVLMLLSPFIKVNAEGISAGEILQAREEREVRLAQIQAVDCHFRSLEKNVLVFLRSDWAVYLRLLGEDNSNEIFYEIDPEENSLASYLEAGYSIYYQGDYYQQIINRTGIDLIDYGAEPFEIKQVASAAPDC